MLVIDLDTSHGEPPPPEFAGAANGHDVLAILADRAGQPAPWRTRTVQTSSGGLHLYFRAPRGLRLRNTNQRLGWLIDTRGQGGFVVAAGSIGRHGPYRTINPSPVTDLPDWLVVALTPAPVANLAAPTGIELPASRATAYLAAIIDRETADLAMAPVGTRHRTRLAAARTLGRLVAGGELTEAEALAYLWQAARRHIGNDCTEREVVRDLHEGVAFGRRLPRHIRRNERTS